MPQVTWCDNGCRKPSVGRLVTVNEFGATVHHLCSECKKARLRPQPPPRKTFDSGEYPTVEKKTG